MPSPQDLDERSRGSFHPSRSAGAALRIAVEIALPPVFKVSSRENGRFVVRHVLHKSSPLFLNADDAPGRAVWTERVTHWIAARDRSEQYHAVDERWVVASKPSGCHRAPGVSDERQGVQALVVTDLDARWLFDAFSHSSIKRDVKIGRGTHLMHLEAMRPALWGETVTFLLGGDVAPVPL